MKNKNLSFIVPILLGATTLNAQSLGLTNGAKQVADEVAGAFPYISVFLFLFVGFRQLSHFSKDGDTMEGVKNIGMYLLVLLVIVGVYQYIKSRSL